MLGLHMETVRYEGATYIGSALYHGGEFVRVIFFIIIETSNESQHMATADH